MIYLADHADHATCTARAPTWPHPADRNLQVSAPSPS
jgi:hypothetical protein